MCQQAEEIISRGQADLEHKMALGQPVDLPPRLPEGQGTGAERRRQSGPAVCQLPFVMKTQGAEGLSHKDKCSYLLSGAPQRTKGNLESGKWTRRIPCPRGTVVYRWGMQSTDLGRLCRADCLSTPVLSPSQAPRFTDSLLSAHDKLTWTYSLHSNLWIGELGSHCTLYQSLPPITCRTLLMSKTTTTTKNQQQQISLTSKLWATALYGCGFPIEWVF